LINQQLIFTNKLLFFFNSSLESFLWAINTIIHLHPHRSTNPINKSPITSITPASLSPQTTFFRIHTLRSMLSRCGGSLVSRRHVVTAGHCVARATPRQVHVTLGESPSLSLFFESQSSTQKLSLAGDYVINSAVEPLPAYTFGVRQISVHPYFKFTPQADRFDVSVLQLERPVHYMPHIGEFSYQTLLAC